MAHSVFREGTPEMVAQVKNSHTGMYLERMFKKAK